MSAGEFKPFYMDGQRVMVGDRVLHAGPPIRLITNVFPPDHEISRLYDMEHGCVEMTPATIESLPCNEDIELIARAGAADDADLNG
jgi:hypothetical protein